MQLKFITLAFMPLALAAPMIANGMRHIYQFCGIAHAITVAAHDALPVAEMNIVAKSPIQEVDSALIKYDDDVVHDVDPALIKYNADVVDNVDPALIKYNADVVE
jgi:hypothetical protein